MWVHPRRLEYYYPQYESLCMLIFSFQSPPPSWWYCLFLFKYRLTIFKSWKYCIEIWGIFMFLFVSIENNRLSIVGKILYFNVKMSRVLCLAMVTTDALWFTVILYAPCLKDKSRYTNLWSLFYRCKRPSGMWNVTSTTMR